MSCVEKIVESDNRNPLESAEVTQEDMGNVDALKSHYESSSPEEKDTLIRRFNDIVKQNMENDASLRFLLETSDKDNPNIGPDQINQLDTFQLWRALSNYPYVPDIIRQSLEKTAYEYANSHGKEISDALAENTEARNQRNFEVEGSSTSDSSVDSWVKMADGMEWVVSTNPSNLNEIVSTSPAWKNKTIQSGIWENGVYNPTTVSNSIAKEQITAGWSFTFWETKQEKAETEMGSGKVIDTTPIITNYDENWNPIIPTPMGAPTPPLGGGLEWTSWWVRTS